VPNPKTGELWLVEFDPQRGAEIKKTRPAIVINIAEINSLPVRIVVPIRGFRDHHATIVFFVKLLPTRGNGLIKESSADCTQVKSFSVDRFVRRLGSIPSSTLEEIRRIVGNCIGLVL